MSTIAANLRAPVPLPETTATTPVRGNEQPSHDEHFSHVLSQKQHDGGDSTTPAPKPAPRAKVAETLAKKETPANDTLQLVNNSNAIQPTVISAPQPVSTTPPANESIDDVPTKTTPAPIIAPALPAPVLTTTNAAPIANPAAGDDTSTVPTNADPSGAKTVANVEDVTATLRAPSQPGTTVTPNDLTSALTAPPHASDTPAFKPAAFRNEPSANAQTPIPANMIPIKPEVITTVPAVPVVNAQIAAPPAPALQQPELAQNNATNVTLPITTDATTNIAPIAATIIAAATSHRIAAKDDSSDDDITPVDSTSAIAGPPLSVAEHRDFAALDGKIPVPSPGSTEFADALGERLSLMAERHIGHAEIHLSPDGMGPLEVRVHMDGSRIRAEFGSNNHDVRQAITDHLPRLREMLSQHGFSLSDAHVGTGSQQQSAAPSHLDDVAINAIDDAATAPQPARAGSAHDGILDEFA